MGKTIRSDKRHHRGMCSPSCDYCRMKRIYKNLKREQAAKSAQKEYENGTGS